MNRKCGISALVGAFGKPYTLVGKSGTDSADGNDQDGERQNQLGTQFSRHG